MGCDIHGILEIKKEKWEAVEEIPDHRGYDMFGILAGVRNYVNAIPISEPKGFPNDASKRTKKEAEAWDWDGHSYSWLTWREIEEYDKEQIFQDSRISRIEKETGKAWSKSSYCGGMKAGDEDKNYYYKCLPISAKEIIDNSGWKSYFEKMEKLAKYYGKDNVRIVFWFDN